PVASQTPATQLAKPVVELAKPVEIPKPEIKEAKKIGASTKSFGTNKVKHTFRKPKFKKGKKKILEKKKPEPQLRQPEPLPKEVEKAIMIREGITVKELSEKLKQPSAKIIPSLMKIGVMASINQRISLDVAELIATELGYKVQREELFKSAELVEAATQSAITSEQLTRPPIVTIMGHVDHGKTKLLDAIRRANVVDGEAGGITQHIGAYTIDKPGKITFIDTPGHEAFTAMRARGASVTDIVVLVVAADDGIMPQTIEAIHHATAAGVPIIVAINKMDLPGANQDRVKQQLADRGLQPEEWGGTTITVPVSAKLGQNLDKLLEMILLQAEIMELKAPVDARAVGVVIEARLDKNKGPVATVLIKSGTLDIGDTFVCGTSSGKVRALFAHDGSRLEFAGPSTPALVLGFDEVPSVGDLLQETENEREARMIADERATDRKNETNAKDVRVSLEDLNQQIDSAKIKELSIIVKGDVGGSVEAIRDILERISDERVRLKVLHGAVGTVTDNDINLAYASNALIVCFNVRCSSSAEALAKQLGVEIRFYEIIYKLEEDIRNAMTGLLSPTIKENFIGRVEVREVFKITKVGAIAGCYVKEGNIKRNVFARVLRDGVVVYTGKISSLKRFKDDVKEVGVNFECGIGIENFNDIKKGDVIEAFVRSEIAAELQDS
ncbi:TPA: translation initiation factor IF-2, partial [bacterium]|nr:translation initiation factor IF-2 [bacterium]